MTELSKNLSLKEVTKSKTAISHGIPNSPTAEHLENLKMVAKHVFQPVRDFFGVRIYVSSGYRSRRLNKVLKRASATSDHCYGFALDLDADVFEGVTNAEIFYYILDNLDFKQLIWEFGDDEQPNWVHVSFDIKNNKKTVLRALKGGGYINFKDGRV